MTRPPLVPPIKCQGIKTKLVPAIKEIVLEQSYSRWIEPFCGSCVVALNIQPKRALLCDTNVHIIRLYQDIQNGVVTPASVGDFLTMEGAKLMSGGQDYYYEVRARFNESGSSFDFLFLNRSCFNGVMRFNRKGGFNVPFCRKPERFAQAYVTKIVNQVRNFAQVVTNADWTFEVRGYRDTLQQATMDDFVYLDPPYAGRHVDYYNSWSEKDEADMVECLRIASYDFLLSTWHSNEFRTNSLIEEVWKPMGLHMLTHEHFYHIGSSESLRHPIIEAFIANFQMKRLSSVGSAWVQPSIFDPPMLSAEIS